MLTSEPSDFDALLIHHRATEAENARLREDIAHWPVCDEHKPDRWEGDGPCVICEAHRNYAELAALREELTEERRWKTMMHDSADRLGQELDALRERHQRVVAALREVADSLCCRRCDPHIVGRIDDILDAEQEASC